MAIQDASRLPLRYICAIGAFAVCGFVLMTISLNYWLRNFSRGKGPFTTAAISAISWDIVLFSVWITHKLSSKPDISFLFTRKAIFLLAIIGFFEALAALLTAYAALGTAEVLQALLSSTVVPLTAVLSFILLPGYNRNMLHWNILLSVICAIGGATTLVLSSHRRTSNTSPWWPFVFFLGAVSNAFHFVLQSKFMLAYTNTTNNDDDATNIPTSRNYLGDAVDDDKSGPHQSSSHSTTTNDFTVKITMLAFDTLAQCIATFAMMPMDAIPGFGKSDSLHNSGENFALGVECIATCANNWKYYTLYVIGFAFSHFACAYLNHYSSTLTAIVIMLQSPVTTVVLLIAPALNVTSVDVPVWGALLSCSLLLVSSASFGFWERRSKAENATVEEQHALHSLEGSGNLHEE